MPNDKISAVGANIAEKAAMIWNVADMLRGPFKPHEYGLVILPMTVVKRFHDCLLPTHQAVLDTYEKVKKLQVIDGFLQKASGYQFYNTSRFTFETLLADPDNIESNFRDYLSGFSTNAQDVLAKFDFDNIVISIKSSNVPRMMAAYRLLASQTDYPLHVGVTEAGGNRMGLIKSGMGIGGLLMEGLGDTLRVSLTDEPENEVYAGYDILRAAGYAVAGPEIISCPTCGRTQYPMIEIANEVERRLRDEGFKKPLKIAIMGCVVNGPGEASDADIGIAGGKDEALLFIRGEKIRMLKGDIVGQLLEEIHKM